MNKQTQTIVIVAALLVVGAALVCGLMCMRVYHG
jgi:hypothetical protein